MHNQILKILVPQCLHVTGRLSVAPCHRRAPRYTVTDTTHIPCLGPLPVTQTLTLGVWTCFTSHRHSQAMSAPCDSLSVPESELDLQGAGLA
eukprot:360663-Chlamydomonas_euryale.AAC.3